MTIFVLVKVNSRFHITLAWGDFFDLNQIFALISPCLFLHPRSQFLCVRSEKETKYLEPERPIGSSKIKSTSQSCVVWCWNISTIRMRTASNNSVSETPRWKRLNSDCNQASKRLSKRRPSFESVQFCLRWQALHLCLGAR